MVMARCVMVRRGMLKRIMPDSYQYMMSLIKHQLPSLEMTVPRSVNQGIFTILFAVQMNLSNGIHRKILALMEILECRQMIQVIHLEELPV